MFRYRLSPETFGYTLKPSLAQHVLMAWYTAKHRDNFTFTLYIYMFIRLKHLNYGIFCVENIINEDLIIIWSFIAISIFLQYFPHIPNVHTQT